MTADGGEARVLGADAGRPRPFHRWRTWLPMVIALVAVGLALGLPSAKPPTPLTVDRTGPTTLGDVWPAARIVNLPSVLSDGSSFQPSLITGGATAVGMARSPDGKTVRLEVVSANSAHAVIRTFAGDDQAIVAALAYSDGQLFWIQIGTDGTGARRTTIWRYRLRDASLEQIASDSGDPDYNHSQYDLEVDDGRLFWTTRRADGRTDVRSVSADGGPVRVETLDGSYTLTTRPWAVRTDNRNLGIQAAGRGADVHLLNLVTHDQINVKATPDQILSCTPAWCRITVDQGTAVMYSVERSDGTALRRIGNGNRVPLLPDVALLDRFVVLGAPNNNSANFSQQLWLLDLTTDRLILLAENATESVDGRDGYLWWSTDSPTTDWQIFDLHQVS